MNWTELKQLPYTLYQQTINNSSSKVFFFCFMECQSSCQQLPSDGWLRIEKIPLQIPINNEFGNPCTKKCKDYEVCIFVLVGCIVVKLFEECDDTFVPYLSHFFGIVWSIKFGWNTFFIFVTPFLWFIHFVNFTTINQVFSTDIIIIIFFLCSFYPHRHTVYLWHLKWYFYMGIKRLRIRKIQLDVWICFS